MAEQLWKGRFSKAVDSRVNDFNSSIRFDQRMIAQDMRGSGVHAAMLARQGIISEQDCADILSGLASIADDLSSGALTIDPAAEDVHTFVEQTLTARIGDAGKRLHTGRSRNDQVALDIRLTLRDYSKTLQAYIVELVRVLCKKAAENTASVMPGYTHLQRAQPITFGHALMAYASMLLRDLDPRPKTFIPSGVQHKLEYAEQLMADFPDMKFILIGDDGQKDPTTYATIARRYPGRVLAICIRQLTPREVAGNIGSVAGRANTQPMPVTDVPVFTGATGSNIMKTMLPYLRATQAADGETD